MDAPGQNRITGQSYRSLEELMDDLNICADENYLPLSQVEKLKTEGWHVLKLMNGYLRYLRDRKFGSSLELREESLSYECAKSEESLEWLEELIEKHPDLKLQTGGTPLI
jgi:hypothetical protein